MALPNIFEKQIADQVIARINALSSSTQAQWGKMNVAQMLAHCNVTYEMAFENIHPKPNAFVKFMLKTFVKKNVVSEKPYNKNGQTAPAFIIKDAKEFDKEKARLIAYITKAQTAGTSFFEGKESHSFGVLTLSEWNNLFYKHLDHHLSQFGV
jgi:Protein of unknown function (DUF1569)